jgi:hypothetical protein
MNGRFSVVIDSRKRFWLLIIDFVDFALNHSNELFFQLLDSKHDQKSHLALTGANYCEYT